MRILISQGDSLAEMWVNFLLEESDKNPRTRSVSRESSFSDGKGLLTGVRSTSSSFSTVSLSSPMASPSQMNSPSKNNYSSSFEMSPPSPKVG